MKQCVFYLLFIVNLYCSIETTIHIPIFNKHSINKDMQKNLKRIVNLHPGCKYIIYSDHMINPQNDFIHKVVHTNEPLLYCLKILYENGGYLIDPCIYLNEGLMQKGATCNLFSNISYFSHLPMHTERIINPTVLAAKKHHPLLKTAINAIETKRPKTYSNNDLESKIYTFYHKYLVPFHKTLRNANTQTYNFKHKFNPKPYSFSDNQDPINKSNLRWAKKIQTLTLYLVLQTLFFFVFLVLKKQHKQYNR